MATNKWIELPVPTGVVTTINGESGAVTLVAGTGISVTPSGQNITIAATGGTGTVTSVALALPGSLFSVSGSPVTTSGTLTGTFTTQTANTVFSGPTSGGAATPTFRAIVSADIPTLNQNTTGTASNITASSNSTLTTLSALSLPTSQLSGTISLTTQVSGILPIANGGTGSATQNFVDLTTNQASIAGNKTFTGTTTDTGNSLIANATASKATIGIVGSTAVHEIDGGLIVTTRTTSANLTIDTTTTDNIIFVDTSGGAVTVTFPTPTNGRVLYIKDSTGSFGTNNCTMARHASEKIEGIAASKILQTAWQSITFTSNGTDWFML